MSLFQTSVVKKYVNGLDHARVEQKYQEFTDYFGKSEIQQHIRSVNEEQFQVHFFRELFVKILGYDLNDKPDYNLDVEFKNINDSKKADGAIVKEGKAIGVIELKSTQTTDLDKVETQAFGYKNHHPECVYVVTSNFEKLRFYVRNAVDYIEFDLFNLTAGDFKLMWLCLEKDNLLSHVPEAMKKASVLQEEDVTKKLYADYAKFREALFNNMVKNNPETDKLSLFKKTQKLLDRFLFIFFAEDRLLVPPNSITQIIDKWEDDVAFGEEKPLYDLFKQYFRVLNQGRPQRGKRPAIFAYNGGLFKPDELLDSVKIDDDVLKEHSLNLSAYDFETDVDVNILGHIFEHSIGEIESVQAEIKGETQDKTKSRRKKEGVFYTPKYITQYIVENTVGKLCEEKRSELGIVDEEYTKGRKNRKKTKLKELIDKLDAYREWLLQLTILDPACGSGAFLNQALDFLIKEHGKIDELRAVLLDESLMLSDITNDILENNIYGVDINDESVEIAKLSLWLRTAAKGRKLNTLSDNIKCGNSLIDDPEVAGDKAFNWQEEFPEVFKKGGFDVVIGNPPYVQLQSLGEESDALSSLGYETFHKGADLYCLFTERGYNLLKKGGLESFIMPNKWMLVAYGKPLRSFLSKTGLRQILNFGDVQFFQGATTYVCIFVAQKAVETEYTQVVSLNHSNYGGDFITEVADNIYNYPTSKFGEGEWSIQPYADSVKLDKMKEKGVKLKELPISIYRGILTGYNDAFFIDAEKRQYLISEDAKSEEIITPIARGRDISAYGLNGYEYIIGTFPTLELDIDKYPAVKKHLLSFGLDRLKQTGEKGSRKKTNGKWFETQDRIGYYQEFDKPKIMYPNMTSAFPFLYDESGLMINDKGFILSAENNSVSLPYLTAVFNSSLAKLWIWYNCPELQGGTREIRKVYFEHFPVPSANEKQTQQLAQYTKTRTHLTAELKKESDKFQRSITRNFNLEKLSSKLQNWFSLDFSEFVKELKKKKVKLALSEEAEWEDYFNEQKQKAQDLQQQIDQTDREIDQMVYELYGLTDEEIKVVEESVG